MNTPLEALERLKAFAAFWEQTDNPDTLIDPPVGMEPNEDGLSTAVASLLTSYEAQGERLREVEGENAALLEETAALTKALTGLTRGGSEYFIRKGDRYTADIPACVSYVREVREMLHRVAADARREVSQARSALTQPPAMEKTDG